MQAMQLSEQDIFSISRPDKSLLRLYVIRAILSGPGAIILLPLLLCRYFTLSYKFDPDGITMSWGLLFKSQITLSYSRIQDIHLESGILQRWFSLADIQIQTASGSSSDEMVLEGLLEYESIRNFIYARMRGYKESHSGNAASKLAAFPSQSIAEDQSRILSSMLAELSAARAAAERLADRRQSDV